MTGSSSKAAGSATLWASPLYLISEIPYLAAGVTLTFTEAPSLTAAVFSSAPSSSTVPSPVFVTVTLCCTGALVKVTSTFRSPVTTALPLQPAGSDTVCSVPPIRTEESSQPSAGLASRATAAFSATETLSVSSPLTFTTPSPVLTTETV